MEVLISLGLVVVLHSVFFLPIQTRVKVPLLNKVTQIVPQLYFFPFSLYRLRDDGYSSPFASVQPAV